MEDRKAWIYALYDIENPSRLRYVGQTISRKGVADRVYHHKWAAQKLGRKYPSSCWIRKIGPERVGYLVLEETSRGEADRLEKRWIRELRSRGMADLNIMDGGLGAQDGKFAGDANPRARLNWDLVRSIREDAQGRYVSTHELSEKYGITPASFSKILRNATWYDPDYDPSKRQLIADANSSEDFGALVWRTVTDAQVEHMRALFLSGKNLTQISKLTGQPTTSVRRCIFDRYGSERTRLACIEKAPKRKPIPPKTSDDFKRAIVARYFAGESQGSLSKEIGVSQGTISNWVHDDRLK